MINGGIHFEKPYMQPFFSVVLRNLRFVSLGIANNRGANKIRRVSPNVSVEGGQKKTTKEDTINDKKVAISKDMLGTIASMCFEYRQYT